MEYRYSGAKLKIRRIPYYLRSLLILLKEIEPKWRLRFFIDLLLPKIKTVKLKKRKLVFRLKTWLDVLTLKEVVLDGEYERYGVKIEDRDRIIVDIGAGFGDFSIFIAKKFPQAKIFAFEPDSAYFVLLKENIRLNKVKNIIPHKMAIRSLRQALNPIQSNPIQCISFNVIF